LFKTASLLSENTNDDKDVDINIFEYFLYASYFINIFLPYLIFATTYEAEIISILSLWEFVKELRKIRAGMRI
jgi:hypothetical protein